MTIRNGWERLQRLATDIRVLLLSFVLGGVLGAQQPGIAGYLGFVGFEYVKLMSLVALPFAASAIAFSLQRLVREGGAAPFLGRIAWVFALFALVATVVAAAVLTLASPGSNRTEEQLRGYGSLLGGLARDESIQVSLRPPAPGAPAEQSVPSVLGQVLPGLPLAQIGQGDILSLLILSLLFGIALGRLPDRIASGLDQSLETIHQCCQTLLQWLNAMLPLLMFAVAAFNTARYGAAPFVAVLDFVAAFAFVCFLLIAAAALIIKQRSGSTWLETFASLRAVFAVAATTGGSAVCMPAMIDGLVDWLQFPKVRVRLLVPLCVSLLRIGPMVYFASATLFVFQLYAEPLGPAQFGLVVLVSVLGGLASAGLSAPTAVAFVGAVCVALGLPFGAAAVLLLAAEPICGVLRTLVIVFTGMAAVAVACPRPLRF